MLRVEPCHSHGAAHHPNADRLASQQAQQHLHTAQTQVVRCDKHVL